MQVYRVVWEVLTKTGLTLTGCDYNWVKHEQLFDDKGQAEKYKTELTTIARKLRVDIYTPPVEELLVSGREAK